MRRSDRLVLSLVVGLLALAVSAPAAVAANGLVAAYAMDQTSGTALPDLSGNANNGTVNGATWTSSGKFGNALSFNGSSNLVTVADSASLDLTTGLTEEAWVRPSSLGSVWRTVLLKEQPGGMVYDLYAHGPPGRTSRRRSSTSAATKRLRGRRHSRSTPGATSRPRTTVGRSGSTSTVSRLPRGASSARSPRRPAR